MQNIPKIVQDRLKAAPAVADHPGADLLTAFSEQALPESERVRVLEHLARCAGCRDVVALALPASEAIEPVPATPRHGWLTWPTLRWAFVAAGVVMIASLGTLQYQRRTQQSAMLTYKSSAASKSPAESSPPPVVAGDNQPANRADQAKKDEKSAGVAADSISASNGTPRAERSSAAGSSVAGTRVEGRLVAEPKRILPAAPSPAPPASSSHRVAPGSPVGGPVVFNQKMAQWQNNNSSAQQLSSNIGGPLRSGNQQPADASVAKQDRSAQSPSVNQTVEVSGQATQLDAQSAAPQPALDGNAGEKSQFYDLAKVDKAKPAAPLAAPGQIGGYVVDPSGAVVSNARITVTPSGTGGTASAMTNSQGAWLIAGLPTGNYKAQAEAPGFKTGVLAFNFNANHPSTYNFTLSPGSVSETVEVSSAQNAQVQTTGSDIAQPVANRMLAQTAVRGGNFTPLSSATAGLQPRWSISPTGGLQCSLDQGSSWQIVDPNPSPASFATAEVVAKSARSKEKDANKKALKRDSATPVFRAVSSTGSDVWAGGSAGVLYHSVDAGNHWTRVVPASGGAFLAGDIVGIDFSDPQHGKITTSSPEVWITSDNGQTWQKQ